MQVMSFYIVLATWHGTNSCACSRCRLCHIMILSYSKRMYLDLILAFNYHYTIVNQPSVLHSSAFILASLSAGNFFLSKGYSTIGKHINKLMGLFQTISIVYVRCNNYIKYC